MSDLAIRVSGLSKQFVLGANQGKYKTLRESITEAVTAPARIFSRREKQNSTSFWALKDVNFEIKRGEVVGIIGRNGAGKSTLLKVLSRIVEPTTGAIDIYGRVGSLLEVGTGFHPELTGRQNIFMNGAILGMTRAEVKSRFDEIVAFSEIERFVDTPVKRYSSGMYTRLAFAVAAHLEPEILIVDEVLAVGDAQFQKKCMGKMKDVAGHGRTVLFVSHNLTTVQALCTKGIMLAKGEVKLVGPVGEVVNAYTSASSSNEFQDAPGSFYVVDRTNKYTPGSVLIKQVIIRDSEGRQNGEIRMGESFSVTIRLQNMRMFPNTQVAVIFKSRMDQWLANFNTGMKPPKDRPDSDTQEYTVHVPHMPFTPGSYWIDVSVGHKTGGRVDAVENVASVDVLESDVYGSGYEIRNADGVIYLNGDWSARTL